jgi:hypothetical protein
MYARSQWEPEHLESPLPFEGLQSIRHRFVETLPDVWKSHCVDESVQLSARNVCSSTILIPTCKIPWFAANLSCTESQIIDQILCAKFWVPCELTGEDNHTYLYSRLPFMSPARRLSKREVGRTLPLFRHGNSPVRTSQFSEKWQWYLPY